MWREISNLRKIAKLAAPLAIGAVASVAALAPATANDGPQFTNATLKGAYGFWFEGQEFSAAIGGLAPIAGIARYVFDGAGNVAIERITVRPSSTGNVTTPAQGREMLTATYIVEPTGKVDISIDGDPEFYTCVLKDDEGVEFGCVLSAENRLTGPFDPDGGNPATYQGTLAAFEARGVRQHGKNFSERQLRGLYTLLVSNISLPPLAGAPEGFVPEITISQFDFDGSGGVSAPIGAIGYLIGLPVLELPPTTPQTSRTTYSVDKNGFATVGGPFIDEFGNPTGGSFEDICILARRGKIAGCIATQFTPLGAPPEVEASTIGITMLERINSGND